MKLFNKSLVVIISFLATSILAEDNGQEKATCPFAEIEGLREAVELLLRNQKELQRTVGNQQETIEDVLQQNQVMAVTIKQLEGTLRSKLKAPIVQDGYQSFGCLLEVIELSCPLSYSINITKAFYGQSPLNCTEQCCTPSPDDCKEEVPDNSLADWSMLLNACNGKQNCSYTYEGAVIHECREDYIAHYMEIIYDCLMYSDDLAPVGFSAYATTSQPYNSGDIIQFDAIVSNIGNHYNTDTYSFTCPYNGLYLFNVIIVAYSSEQMTAYIVHDDIVLLGLYTAYDDYPAASATVVTECKVGESVWVQCFSSNDYLFAGYKSSHFSGALLQAYV